MREREGEEGGTMREEEGEGERGREKEGGERGVVSDWVGNEREIE